MRRAVDVFVAVAVHKCLVGYEDFLDVEMKKHGWFWWQCIDYISCEVTEKIRLTVVVTFQENYHHFVTSCVIYYLSAEVVHILTK